MPVCVYKVPRKVIIVVMKNVTQKCPLESEAGKTQKGKTSSTKLFAKRQCRKYTDVKFAGLGNLHANRRRIAPRGHHEPNRRSAYQAAKPPNCTK